MRAHARAIEGGRERENERKRGVCGGGGACRERESFTSCGRCFPLSRMQFFFMANFRTQMHACKLDLQPANMERERERERERETLFRKHDAGLLGRVLEHQRYCTSGDSHAIRSGGVHGNE